MEKEYKVGWKNPPLETRFQKGKSGNPSGKPKGAKSFYTMVNDIANGRVKMTRDGKPVRISRKEAALLQLITQAAKGDLKACKLAIPKLIEAETKAAEHDAKSNELSRTDEDILQAYFNNCKNNNENNHDNND
jgi:hypothetical protein